MSNVTHILHAIENGDAQAANELLTLVYQEFRRLAARKMAKEAGKNLSFSSLRSSRLCGLKGRTWNFVQRRTL